MRKFTTDENSGKEVGVFYHSEQVRADDIYLGYYIIPHSIQGDTKVAMLKSEIPTDMDKFDFRFNKDRFGLWIK